MRVSMGVLRDRPMQARSTEPTAADGWQMKFYYKYLQFGVFPAVRSEPKRYANLSGIQIIEIFLILMRGSR